MIPEKACPGLDPGCEAVFGKDRAQKSYLYSRTAFTRDDSAS